MADNDKYDAIVVGAGQAGGPLATALARAGWRTALIERKHAGGTCINEGCTPTKTMVASARVAYLARRAADYGVQTGPVSIEMSKVRERKRAIVKSFRGGSERRIEATEGLDYILGDASFSGTKSLEVRLNAGGTRQLAGERVFVNTGARPQRLPLPGLENVSALDSTSIMELDKVPEHLIVMGGGYVGIEFAQMFRRFGSRVTIVQRRGQLLTQEDVDVAAEVARILRDDGIEILLDANTLGVEPVGTQVRLGVDTSDGVRQLTGSQLLLAAGRVPNTETLNLAATGIRPDERGYIPVNERLETVVPGIYAMGDVKGGPAFTHISYDDFRILRSNLLEDGDASTSERLLPYVVFMDPQLARIGLSERAARAQGRKIQVAKMPMTSVARALEVDETRGFMKAVVDAASAQILGAAVLGIEGGEIMGIIQVAMMGHLPYTAVKEAVFAHPTLSEALNNLFANLKE